jgi:hypothetical protein
MVTDDPIFAESVNRSLPRQTGFETMPENPTDTWTLSESIPWLTLSSTGGTGPATVTVSVDRSGLSEGSYNGTINASVGVEPVTVNVTMEVPDRPDLVVADIGFTDYYTPYLPSLINISAKIENTGSVTATNASVDFYLDTVNHANLISSVMISKPIGIGKGIRSPWFTYTLPSKLWEAKTVIARVSTTIESNTSNNEMSNEYPSIIPKLRMTAIFA